MRIRESSIMNNQGQSRNSDHFVVVAVLHDGLGILSWRLTNQNAGSRLSDDSYIWAAADSQNVWRAAEHFAQRPLEELLS